MTGTIIRVANIGEQLRNSESKVFEVVISIHEKDTTLRPAMTTSNTILVAAEEEALHIPLECLHTFEQDSTKYNYVFVKQGASTIKQEVKIGLINENEVIIEEGLTKTDKLLLNSPTNHEDFEIRRFPA